MHRLEQIVFQAGAGVLRVRVEILAAASIYTAPASLLQPVFSQSPVDADARMRHLTCAAVPDEA